jgi:lipopolysaccharide biosynthesis glycosyltransferase
MIEIGFAVDRFTEDCAYVAIHSLLKRSSKPVSIMVCYESRESRPGKNWEKKLKTQGFQFDLRYCKIDISKFLKCKNFFDSWTNYLRIYAPDCCEYNKFIYSDVDVVFSDDVYELHKLDISNKIIALPGGIPCSERSTKEQKALFAYGRAPQELYFGSGLAVINVKDYRDSKISRKCEEVAARIPESLLFHEQSIWNCVFSNDDILPIEERWCQCLPLNTSDLMPDLKPGIYHFAGSPKPWDLLGEFYHKSYEVWAAAARDAGMYSQKYRKYIDLNYLKRAKRIRRQYDSWFK